MISSLIPIQKDYIEEETEELKGLLSDLKKLNEVQNDLNLMLEEQDEQIEKVVEDTEITLDLAQNSNIQLEAASKLKIKIVPIAIGAGVGMFTGLGVGGYLLSQHIITASILVYSTIGTAIVGSYGAKTLS